MARELLGVGRGTWLLLAAVPLALVLDAAHAPPAVVFAACGLGIVPLAGLMGTATEELSARSGPAVGGLLNATFGNAAELILTLFALRAGLIDLVKASLVGSVLGNLLLVLGAAIIAGSWRAPKVAFSATSAGAAVGMMTLALAGFASPALFSLAHPDPSPAVLLRLSDAVAVLLLATYACSLLFTLKTHRALLSHGPAAPPRWSVAKAVGVLVAATALVAWLSEVLVGVVNEASVALGLSATFIGLFLVPAIGNAAEHATAVVVARKGQMDLAFQIAAGSSAQVALFVAPVLVACGHLLGQRMDFAFSTFEVAALGLASLGVAVVALDGESNWFEGVQLVGLYGVLGAGAYFI